MKARKDRTFLMRLDASDKERLKRLAEHYPAPMANVIRMLIKAEFDRLDLVEEEGSAE